MSVTQSTPTKVTVRQASAAAQAAVSDPVTAVADFVALANNHLQIEAKFWTHLIDSRWFHSIDAQLMIDTRSRRPFGSDSRQPVAGSR